MVACIAPAQGGGFIGGMETGLFRLHLRDDGSVDRHLLAAPPALVLQMQAGLLHSGAGIEVQTVIPGQSA